jgi:4-aminobutyrate aminotransferase-like enzyme
MKWPSNTPVLCIKSEIINRKFANERPAAFSIVDQQSAAINEAPGTTDYKVLSFEGGHHGYTMAALSASTTFKKVNLPQLNWPIIPFPENESDEAACLERARETMMKGDLAAVIIEPFMLSKFKSASTNFYNQLRNLANENDVSFIVDETNTCCGTTG